MSLLGTIHMANNTLLATQIGLQVSGNNIANADTPGYVRQEVIFTPAPTQLRGNLALGMGVRVAGIVQKVDNFLRERLRGAISDVENSDIQQQAYLELEAVLSELGDTDLSSSLTEFFSSINNVLNEPENLGVRNQAVVQGDTLARSIRQVDARVVELRENANRQVVEAASEINQLLERVSELNREIVQIEATTRGGEAGGLRDERALALESLASLVGVRSIEEESGAVSVLAGGEFLVFENGYQQVTVQQTPDQGIALAEIVIERSQAPVVSSTGKVAGLYTARDDILGGFLEQLDEFAGALAIEFNRLFSQGQGLTGFTELTSEHSVDDVTEPLDQVGLAATPTNGSFQVQVRDRQTGIVKTADILVDLNGFDEDTSLEDLAQALGAIDGINAAVTAGGNLQINSASGSEFSFANDTSGVLAALGLNVFFTGSDAADLAISSVLALDPSKFAASRGGIGNDADNAVELAAFANRSLASFQGKSITDIYEEIVVETTQASAVRQSVTDGFRGFQRTLEAQHLATSGVSIDDEAVKILTHQRMYQASARVISTIADLLDTLINL